MTLIVYSLLLLNKVNLVKILTLGEKWIPSFIRLPLPGGVETPYKYKEYLLKLINKHPLLLCETKLPDTLRKGETTNAFVLNMSLFSKLSGAQAYLVTTLVRNIQWGVAFLHAGK